MCVCVVRVTVPRQFLNIAKERYNIVYRKTRYIHLSFDTKRGYIRRRKSRRSIKSNSLSTCENFFFFLSFFFFFFKNITLLLFPPRFNAFYRERNIFSKFSIHPTWRTTWVAYGKKFERRIKGTLWYTVLNFFLEIFYYLNSKIPLL